MKQESKSFGGDVYTFKTQDKTLDFLCEKLLKTAPNQPALSSLQARVVLQVVSDLVEVW